MNALLLVFACLSPGGFISEDFNSFTEATPLPVVFDGFGLYGNNGPSSIQPDTLRGLTVGQGTPYVFFAVQNYHRPRIWFSDPVDLVRFDLQVGDRILCEPSKWHFLTSTQGQINDGWNANAVFYDDSWNVLGSIPLYEGPAATFEFRSEGIRRVLFELADPGFCQPIGMDNLRTTVVPVPSSLVLLVGLGLSTIGLARLSRPLKALK